MNIAEQTVKREREKKRVLDRRKKTNEFRRLITATRRTTKPKINIKMKEWILIDPLKRI